MVHSSDMRRMTWFSTHPRRVEYLWIAVVFLVALMPRLVGIGKFLTADEKNWVGRGWEFTSAFRDFRFNDTLQTTHPGIPTLWIAGISTAVTSALRHMPFTFDAIRTFLVASQVPMAVINSALIAAMLLPLQRLVRPRLALLATLVIALDPFLVGHGKLVHVDALLTGTTVLALLLLLASTQRSRDAAMSARYRRGLFMSSAVMSGFAILSKIPGIILLPFAIGVLGSQWRGGETAAASWRTAVRVIGQWLTIVLSTILFLWPGLLWVPDPIGNIKIVKRDLLVAVTTPHHMAEDYTLNPWQYPATLVARTTVPTLIGACIFLALLVGATFRARRGRTQANRALLQNTIDLRTAWLLSAYVALFILGMTLGAKKGDRYLLPVFPVLDLFATLGIALCVARFRPHWPDWKHIATVALVLLFPLAGELTRLGPYALSHYNPLVPPNFSQELGWGEGLDQVAEYLNALPDKQQVAAASWYPEELRALTRRPVFSITAHTQIRTGYVVLYRNMFGRPQDHYANDFIDEYYRKQTPVFVARVNGLDYAWVYRRPAYNATLGELLPGNVVIAELPVPAGTLEAVEVYLATYSGKADRGTLTLHVHSSPDGPAVRTSTLPIRAEDDNAWIRFTLPPLKIQTARTLLVSLEAQGTVPGNAPTVRYAPREVGAPKYGIGLRSEGAATVPAKHPGRGLVGIHAVVR